MAEPLLTRLQNHIAGMAPHQKQREAGKLLIEAAREIEALQEAYRALHDHALGISQQPLQLKLSSHG